MGPSLAESAGNKAVGASAVRRIPRLTLALGFTAALATEIISRQWRWSVGLAIGTIIGWLNFRILQRGVHAFLSAAHMTEAGKRPRAPVMAALFRYALIGLGVYVSFKYLHVPLVSLVAGLCAFGVATIAASIWAILHPEE